LAKFHLLKIFEHLRVVLKQKQWQEAASILWTHKYLYQSQKLRFTNLLHV
jgi:hypothetical protein